ncbi:MAG: hypothetical protein WC533_00530 [Candidatus Pacearchaeota archaeon]
MAISAREPSAHYEEPSFYLHEGKTIGDVEGTLEDYFSKFHGGFTKTREGYSFRLRKHWYNSKVTLTGEERDTGGLPRKAVLVKLSLDITPKGNLREKSVRRIHNKISRELPSYLARLKMQIDTSESTLPVSVGFLSCRPSYRRVQSFLSELFT